MTDTTDPVNMAASVIKDPAGHLWVILLILLAIAWLAPVTKAERNPLKPPISFLTQATEIKDQRGRRFCGPLKRWLSDEECKRRTKMIEYLPRAHKDVAFMEIGEIFRNRGFAIITLPVSTDRAVNSLTDVKQTLYQEKTRKNRPSHLSTTNLNRILDKVDHVQNLIRIVDTSVATRSITMKGIPRQKRSFALVNVELGDSVQHFFHGMETMIHGTTFDKLVNQTNHLAIKTDALQINMDGMENEVTKLVRKIARDGNITEVSLQALAGMINLNEYSNNMRALGEDLHRATLGGYLGPHILPYKKADEIILKLQSKLQQVGLTPAIADRNDLYKVPLLRKREKGTVTFYMMVPTIGIMDKPWKAYEINPIKLAFQKEPHVNGQKDKVYSIDTNKDIVAIEDTFEAEADSMELSTETFSKECDNFGQRTWVCNGQTVSKNLGDTCLASILLQWNQTKCQFTEIEQPSPTVDHFKMVQRRTTYFPEQTQARITCRDDIEDVLVWGMQVWSDDLSRCGFETEDWIIPPQHLVIGEGKDPVLAPLAHDPSPMDEQDGLVQTRWLQPEPEEEQHQLLGEEVVELVQRESSRRGPSTLALASVIIATLALVWAVVNTGFMPVIMKVLRGDMARPVRIPDTEVVTSVVRNWNSIAGRIQTLIESDDGARVAHAANSGVADLEGQPPRDDTWQSHNTSLTMTGLVSSTPTKNGRIHGTGGDESESKNPN